MIIKIGKYMQADGRSTTNLRGCYLVIAGYKRPDWLKITSENLQYNSFTDKYKISAYGVWYNSGKTFAVKDLPCEIDRRFDCIVLNKPIFGFWSFDKIVFNEICEFVKCRVEEQKLKSFQDEFFKDHATLEVSPDTKTTQILCD